MTRNQRRQNRRARSSRRPTTYRPWAEILEVRSLMATFLVNTTLDEVALNPAAGTGLTTDGTITLRSAIQAANALGGINTITLPAGTYTLTIPGAGENAAATGDLDINSDLTINGAGEATTTVNGGGLDRVFEINNTGSNSVGGVTLSGLTVTGGATQDRNGSTGGGGILIDNGPVTLNDVAVTNNRTIAEYGGGGGIANFGQLTMTGCTVSENQAADGGGGILNNAQLTMTGSTVNGNSTSAGQYGVGGGGGILNDAQLTMTGCTVNSNSGGNGGGIYNSSPLTMTGCTVDGNTAGGGEYGGGGGGIYVAGSAPTIVQCTISNNTASGVGGGIAGVQSLTSNFLMINDTISGNNAGGYGGGLFFNFYGSGSNGTSLLNLTIANNSATRGGGAIAYFGNTPLAISNTILAGSHSGNYFAASGTTTVTSQGHNLVDDDSAKSVFNAAGDLNDINAKLGPLADNGGPTMTQALLPGNPAINAGAASEDTPTTDQRGVARPQGVANDIGAFELVQSAQEVATTTTLVSNANTSTFGQTVTLTATVAATGSGLVPTGSVTFLEGTTVLGTAPLDAAGHAVFHTSLPVGPHSIVASYPQTGNFDPSHSSPLAQTVNRVSTTAQLTSNDSVATVGQSVTFTATIAPTSGAHIPTGQVTFHDGATVLGTAVLDAAGHANLTVSSLSAGEHTITASYPGDGTFGPSVSTVANLVVSVPPPVVTGVDRFGYHMMPTTLVVGFSQPLDRSSAENPANYVIVGPHHRVIAVRSASYDLPTQTVTLRPVGRLNIHWLYQLTLNGHSPGGLTGVGGSPLDGQGDGQPGTDYVTIISRANLVNDPATARSTSSHPAVKPLVAVNGHGHPRAAMLRAHLTRSFHAVTLSAFHFRNPKH